ncbi:hypothetical protein BH24ACT4_BH24ACT4_05670 [soil metagenome]
MVELELPETSEQGDPVAFLDDDLGSCTDGELVERLLAAQRMRARLDAAVVAVTGQFDARTVWAGDGARNAPGWIAARVGVAYGEAKTDLHLARDLRRHPRITQAHRAGQLTRDQVRALLKARQPGLEEVFDAYEQNLVDEIAGHTLAAGRRYLVRWVQGVRDILGIPAPEGTEPEGGHGRSRARLSPVGDRWAGDLDLSGIDGEIVANAIDNQISALWNDGVFTRDDGLDPAERRAIALVQVIERGTRGGDDDGTARPLVLALTNRDVLTRRPTDGAHEGDPAAAGEAGEGHTAGGPRDQAEGASGPGTTGGHDRPDTGPPSDPTRRTSAQEAAALGAPNAHGDHTRGTPPPPWPLPDPHPGPDRPTTGPGPADPLAGLDPMTPYPAMLSELARTGPIHPDIVRRLACEGTVVPVYVGDGADELNMGRTIRLANRAQRRNLRLRDGCCQFPGCSVAPEWCIAHHLVWWDDGGPTDMINLVLLCRYHHRLVHGGGFTMTREPDGTVVTTRTDRQPLTPPLQPVVPVIRAQPPPPPIDLDTDEIPFHQAQYMARCRINDLIREAEVRRGCRRRDPTDTTRLRC